MGLHVCESGPVEAPTIVFLHGGGQSGQSWQPVVERLHQYRCLAPDLPEHGQSVDAGPFEMARAADAVADIIRPLVGSGRVHLVGHSLGAQVTTQLLATEPELIDRAVLCGPVFNARPGVWLARMLLKVAVGIPPTMRSVVAASSGFTVPAGVHRSDSPTLILTGANESPFVHRSATVLSQRMSNGVAGFATGMTHNWPLHYPDLFSRTVDGWISGASLPPGIELANSPHG
jgi:pimeloyl-ACP methyl ester carboxylesterase